MDPLGEKEQRRRAPTFAEIAKEYLERHALPKKKSGKVDAVVLDRDVLPLWGKRKAEDIKRRDVIALVEAKAKSAPIAANRLRWYAECSTGQSAGTCWSTTHVFR